MIFISNSVRPNEKESTYWVDIKENPYGGVVKYYDDSVDKWVYLEEPRFQNSAAYNLTEGNMADIQAIPSMSDHVDSLQLQVDTLDESKADITGVYNTEYVDNLELDLRAQIGIIAGEGNTNYQALIEKIDSGDMLNHSDIVVLQTNVTAMQKEVGSMANKYVQQVEGKDLISIKEIARLALVDNYDDTAVKNSIDLCATKVYVETRLQQVIGTSPDVLDTLEELAAALGDDPNFAATMTTELAKKADKDTVYTKEGTETLLEGYLSKQDANNTIYTIVSSMMPTNLSQFKNDVGYITVELDPTIPTWAKQTDKPSYTAEEVGALPSSTTIPTHTSHLINDKAFTTVTEVKNLIKTEGQLTDEQIAKINFMNTVCSYTIDDASSLSQFNGKNALYLDSTYKTHVINLLTSVSELVLQFDEVPLSGAKYVIYVTPLTETNISFPVLNTTSYETMCVTSTFKFEISVVSVGINGLSTEGINVIATESSEVVTVDSQSACVLEYDDGVGGGSVRSGQNDVTTLESLPVDKQVVVAQLSADSTLSLASDMTPGDELIVIILTDSEVNVTFLSELTTGDSHTLLVQNGFELNVLCYNTPNGLTYSIRF